MKTFEERYTAWIDGQLSGEALASFEQELADHPDALTDRAAAHQLGTLLRTHADVPKLANADFFNLQLLQRIEAENPKPHVGAPRASSGWSWSFARLAWAGAACLGLAAILYTTLIPTAPPVAPSDYFAQVVEAWPADPGISATTVYNPEDNVTVLWLDGLDYVPVDKLALQ